MSDEILKRVASLAREERDTDAEKWDSRWEALCAGDLPAEDREELRAWAEESADAAALWQALQPADADFRARITHQACRELDAPVIPIASRKSSSPMRRWLPPLAAAAAMVLFFLWPGGGPLPTYELSLTGATREIRSETSAEAPGPRGIWVAGNRLRLTLTPDQAAEGRVTARMFLWRSDQLEVLEAAPKISRNGAVLIEGEIGREIALPSGDALLVVVVGGPSQLPSEAELTTWLESADPPPEPEAWQGWKIPLRMQ